MACGTRCRRISPLRAGRPLKWLADVAADQSVVMTEAAEVIERGLMRAGQFREEARESPQLAEMPSGMSQGRAAGTPPMTLFVPRRNGV